MLETIYKVLGFIRNTIGRWAIYTAPLLVLIHILVGNLHLIAEGLDEMAVKMNTIASGSSAMPIIDQLWNNANYFFPLEACFAMAMILLQLKVLCVGVRILKSVIPTIG